MATGVCEDATSCQMNAFTYDSELYSQSEIIADGGPGMDPSLDCCCSHLLSDTQSCA